MSALCAAACGLLALAAPVFVLVSWTSMSPDQLIESRLIPHDAPVSAGLAGWQRLVGALVSLVPAAFLSFGLIRVRRCLSAFGQGRFFEAGAVAGLRDFAAAVFWGVIASVAAQSAISVIVTWTNPPGHRELSVGLSGGQVFSALYAAIFWLVAAAMARAASLAHENEQFV